MISVRPVRVLSLVALLLVLAHVLLLVGHDTFGLRRDAGLPRQVDLNGEGNLTAWYSSFLLLCCAAIGAGLTTVARRDGGGAVGSSLAGRWLALSVLLGLMAIDETAQLHDLATGPLRRGLGIHYGLFHFAWLLPAVLVLAWASVYFTPLVRSLQPVMRTRLLIALAVYFGGAVGFEMLGGVVVSGGHETVRYQVVQALEETLELAGALLLIAVLLALLRGTGATLVVLVHDTNRDVKVGVRAEPAPVTAPGRRSE